MLWAVPPLEPENVMITTTLLPGQGLGWYSVDHQNLNFCHARAWEDKVLKILSNSRCANTAVGRIHPLPLLVPLFGCTAGGTEGAEAL